jgi:hypothetical protein
MKIPKKYYHFEEVQKVSASLMKNGYPRLQILLLVTLTGLAGSFHHI